MPDLSQLTRGKFTVVIKAWLITFISLWISSPFIRKGVAFMLWQLYDLFIGKQIP